MEIYVKISFISILSIFVLVFKHDFIIGIHHLWLSNLIAGGNDGRFFRVTTFH